MDRLSEIRARYEAFEDSSDAYKGVRPQYILPVLADDGYSHNWSEIAAHSHEDIPYLLGRLEEAEAALSDMRFAYVNKDPDVPHAFEVDAMNTAAGILGEWPPKGE